MLPDSNAVFSLDHKILKELGVSEVWQASIYNILTLFFLTLRRAAEDCSPNRNIHSLAVPLRAEGRGGDNPRNHRRWVGSNSTPKGRNLPGWMAGGGHRRAERFWKKFTLAEDFQ